MERNHESSGSESEQSFKGQELAADLEALSNDGRADLQRPAPPENVAPPVGQIPEQVHQHEIQEPPERHSLVVSLLGPTASGKSTIIEKVVGQLDAKGLSSLIIKKDDAIRKLSREHHGEGKEWRGYTPLRKFNEQDVNAEINHEIMNNIGEFDVILLEGGTRTRKSAETTLAGVKDKADYVIAKLDVSTKVIRSRLSARRKEKGRVDDMLPLAALKLAGQFVRPRLAESPKTGDQDVETINANNSPDQVAADLLRVIESKRVQ